MEREATEMERRVAESLGNYLDDNLTDDDRLDAARKAIRAMYEPTEDMIDSGSGALSGFDNDWETTHERVPLVWSEMIDAASPPPEAPGQGP